MSRRYVYEPAWRPSHFQEAMNKLRLTPSDVAWLCCVAHQRVMGWLDGAQPVPPNIQRDMTLWMASPAMLDAAWEWTERHARYKDGPEGMKPRARRGSVSASQSRA